MLSTEQLRRLSTIRKTVKEMLDDRGYDVSQLQDVVVQESTTRKNFEFNVALLNNDSEKIYVLFREGKVMVNTIRECFLFLRNINAFKALLIGAKISKFAETLIKEFAAGGYDIEFFKEAALMFNVTKHQDVPKHEVMSEAEKQSFLEKNNILETQLPNILVTDPVAKYYGVKEGQLVRIYRPGSLYYRLAIVDDQVD